MISHGCSISLSHTTHKLGLYFLLISTLYTYQEALSFVIMGHGITWESEKANLFYLFFMGSGGMRLWVLRLSIHLLWWI